MRGILFVLSCLCSMSSWADAIPLSADDWARPRSGEGLTHDETIERVMKNFEQLPQSVIVIRHANDEDDSLWAEELRSWLVALGVSSAHIRLETRAELQGLSQLDLEVVNP